MSWWRRPTKVDLEQAVVDGDRAALRAIVRRVPALARERIQGTAYGPLVFAAATDDLALLDACAGADRLAHDSALALRQLGLVTAHALLAHPQLGAVPASYLGVAHLCGAERVYARLARDATVAEHALCLPLAVALHDDTWFAALVARGARADAIEYPGYHLAMLDPTPAQHAQIVATGGAADPIVSTAPPGFEEGDFPVVTLAEARRAGLGWWLAPFRRRA